jgi:hypothetical protein
MAFQIEPRHDISPNEIDAIEDRLYVHNSYATGRHDGQNLGFVIRNGEGRALGDGALVFKGGSCDEGEGRVERKSRSWNLSPLCPQ